MKTMLILGTLTAALLTSAPAWADHNATSTTPAAAEPEQGIRPPGSTTTDSSLDVDLKVGIKGFRFGGRLFGKDGYAGGAWLNGETRSDGFSLDGRFERDGHAHNFKMNVDVDEWLRRAARWWTRGATDL